MWIGHRTEFLKRTFRALALPRILPSLFLLRGGAGGFEEVNLDHSEVTSYSFMRMHGGMATVFLAATSSLNTN